MHSALVWKLVAPVILVAGCSSSSTSSTKTATAPTETARPTTASETTLSPMTTVAAPTIASTTSSATTTTPPPTAAAATTTVAPEDARPQVSGTSVGFVMAYDATARQIIAVDDRETWRLDPVTDIWTKSAAPSPFFSSTPSLVYVPAVGAVLLVDRTGKVASYDVAADAWTVLATQALDAPGFRPSVVLDSTSGDLIRFAIGAASSSNTRVWRFDIIRRSWTEDSPTALSPTAQPESSRSVLMVDVPELSGQVVIISGTNFVAGSVAGVWKFDPSSATPWTALASMPQLTFPFGAPAGTEAVYVPSTHRLVVISGGVSAEYDPAGDAWTLYVNGAVTTNSTSMDGVPRKLDLATVYDPIGDRVLVYAGATWTGKDWIPLEDMWAYSPTTHAWTKVLRDLAHS